MLILQIQSAAAIRIVFFIIMLFLLYLCDKDTRITLKKEIIIAVLPGIGVLILLGRYTNFIRFIAESCSFVIFDREANINCTLA